MRILVHDYAGHPFQVQLSRGLAARGHDVLHLYSASVQTPRGELTRRDSDPASFAIDGVKLSREIAKYRFFDRFKLESEYGRLLVDRVRAFRPDVVLSANTPSLVEHRLARQCRGDRVRLATWVQDLYGLAAYRILKKKLPGLGHLVGRYFMHLDRAACMMSDAVVVITEDFLPQMRAWGIDEQKVHVVHNWAPIENLPVQPRDNSWSRSEQLGTDVRFVYSGTLSIRHNPDLLLQLARMLHQQGAGEVVVISQGAAIDWLRECAAAEKLTNLRCLPFQPFEKMSEVFGSADVLLAILEPDAGVFCVPSKVLSYLCAGRPMLAAIPRENLSARIIESHSAGRVVNPDDAAGFLEYARELATSPELRREMGRAARTYAEDHFDFERICDRFETILGKESGVNRQEQAPSRRERAVS